MEWADWYGRNCMDDGVGHRPCAAEMVQGGTRSEKNGHIPPGIMPRKHVAAVDRALRAATKEMRVLAWLHYIVPGEALTKARSMEVSMRTYYRRLRSLRKLVQEYVTP